jgi:SMP-30/Gluconolactonase/LRE-like region
MRQWSASSRESPLEGKVDRGFVLKRTRSAGSDLPHLTALRSTVVLTGLWLACSGDPLSAADFQYPLAVTAAGGTAFVADRNLPGLWSIAEGSAKRFFQGSKQLRTPLNAIRCVAMDRQGRLLAGDSSTRQVYRFEGNTPVPLLKTKTGIGIPMGLAVDRHESIFIADLESHRIWKLSAGSDTPKEFAAVVGPRGMTIDDEDRLWVVSHGPDQLLKIAPDGKFDIVVPGRPFQFPHSVALDDRKMAYVTDGYSKTVWKIDASGKPAKWISGEPLKNPVGLCWSENRLLIADPHAKALFAADREGTLTRLFPSASAP